jgi:hypothetical protein
LIKQIVEICKKNEISVYAVFEIWDSVNEHCETLFPLITCQINKYKELWFPVILCEGENDIKDIIWKLKTLYGIK